MEVKEMYTVFKTSDGLIYKIEPALIPMEHVEHWRDAGVYLTKEDLTKMGITWKKE